MKVLKSILFLFCLSLISNLQASEYVSFVKEGKVFHLVDEAGTILSKEPMTKVMEFYNGYASCVINKNWYTAKIRASDVSVFQPLSSSIQTPNKWQ